MVGEYVEEGVRLSGREGRVGHEVECFAGTWWFLFRCGKSKLCIIAAWVQRIDNDVSDDGGRRKLGMRLRSLRLAGAERQRQHLILIVKGKMTPKQVLLTLRSGIYSLY